MVALALVLCLLGQSAVFADTARRSIAVLEYRGKNFDASAVWVPHQGQQTLHCAGSWIRDEPVRSEFERACAQASPEGDQGLIAEAIGSRGVKTLSLSGSDAAPHHAPARLCRDLKRMGIGGRDRRLRPRPAVTRCP